MIPEKDGESIADITVISTDEQAVEVSKQLIDCCEKEGIPSEKATIISVAAEELTSNIAHYGYKGNKPSFIDIRLSKVEGRLVSFDPTEYSSGESDEFSLGGIELIRSVADKMTYNRVLNMNNTVIEVALDTVGKEENQ